MNERIGELAYETDVWCRANAKALKGPSWEKKFAELIIQECMSQIALIGISNSENEDISWACHKAVKNIKDQFGIE